MVPSFFYPRLFLRLSTPGGPLGTDFPADRKRLLLRRRRRRRRRRRCDERD